MRLETGVRQHFARELESGKGRCGGCIGRPPKRETRRTRKGPSGVPCVGPERSSRRFLGVATAAAAEMEMPPCYMPPACFLRFALLSVDVVWLMVWLWLVVIWYRGAL